MPDAGVNYTDNRFEEITGRLHEIYRAAQREITEKLDAHTKRTNALDREKRAQLRAGAITEKQYQDWLRGRVFIGKQWQDKVTSITTTLLHANEQANAMIQGDRRAVFGENMLYQAFRIEKDAEIGLSFSVYDSGAVTRLLRDQPNLLPVRQLSAERDMAWNRRNVANAVTQGIIQGDSAQQVADRIAEKTGNTNEKAMLRYARTALTGAQNAGRIETMREAREMGIKVKKVWIATLDSRTRPAHADLDGQTQDVGEPFDSLLGPIMFPGDPDADDANVWNCRCTLGYDYEEYPSENARRYDQEAGEDIDDIEYSDWVAEKHPDWLRR